MFDFYLLTVRLEDKTDKQFIDTKNNIENELRDII